MDDMAKKIPYRPALEEVVTLYVPDYFPTWNTVNPYEGARMRNNFV